MRCASLVILAYGALSPCADSQRSGKGSTGAWLTTGRGDTPRGERQGANIGVLNGLTKECTWKSTILWGRLLSKCRRWVTSPLSNTIGIVGRWRRKLGAFHFPTGTIRSMVEESLQLASLGSDRYRIKRRSP